MERLLKIFEPSKNVDLSDMKNHWLVIINHLSMYKFEIHIPKDVFEWDVSLFDKNNREVWKDWADIYISGEITKATQPHYFWADIEYFYNKVISSSDFRIVADEGIKIFGKKFLKSNKLEGKIDGVWQNIEPGDLPLDFKIEENLM